MTATSHAVVGTIIAAKIGNPFLAIPIAVASHAVCDVFPHWDSGTNEDKKTLKRITIEAAIDVLLGFAISYVLINTLFPGTNYIYAFIMIIAAQSLDWLTIPYYFLHFKFPPFSWIYALQVKLNSRLDKPWGIINQVIIVLILIFLAKVIS